MRLKLSLEEVQMAASIGVQRRMSGLQAGRRDKHGFKDDGFAIDIQGAVAELAVAKLFGLYWDGLRSSQSLTTRPDVGPLEVRSSPYRTACLIHHPEDDPHRAYVLVAGKAPDDLYIQGWLFGRECRRDEWWRKPPEVRQGGAAWFVPAEALRPLEQLRAEYVPV